MTNPNNYQFGAKKTLQKVDNTATSTANLKISNTGSSCSNKNKIKRQMLSTTQNKVLRYLWSTRGLNYASFWVTIMPVGAFSSLK